MTLLSIVVAVGIGGLETLGLLVHRIPSPDPHLLGRMLNSLGLGIILLFACTLAAFAWRFQKRRPLPALSAKGRAAPDSP